ncbi:MULTISPECIES: LysR family transcriptional regulator [Paenibacillus]|uniref:LysR family transcriptional regulator n=1 Tax=Paenibacillus TaxID=44249 RepID=UPI0011A6D4A4|nr:MULTISPECIES: LysR family transcriptional regulator [Paenibacillus]MCM3171878.1 LysR family transcriptional regulator [Paenibacillus sp. MER 99-2]
MDLLQLQYFQTVARIQHMTQAAHHLHISQPALSKMIALLEAELGTKLFDRKHKGIRLNEHGELFLQQVDIALRALEDGKLQLQDLKGSASSFVAFDVRVASHLLPDILSDFCAQCPNAEFKLLQHASSHIGVADYDLCLSDGVSLSDDTHSVTILREEIYVAVPASHAFAARGQIAIKELRDESFIMLPPGKSLRETTDAFCRLAGFTPKVRFVSDDPATVRGLIRAGQGVAFFPAITWGGSSGSEVTLLRLEESWSYRSISLSWPQNRYLTHTVKQFREFIINYFARLEDLHRVQ